MTPLAALGFVFLGVIVGVGFAVAVYLYFVTHLFPDKDIRPALIERFIKRKG